MDTPDNYQKLTEEIAQKGGLATDLRTSTDPIYSIQKQGEFWRSTKYKIQQSINNPIFALVVAVIFFILLLFTIGFPYVVPY